MRSQKDGVYSTVEAVMSESGRSVEPDVKVELSTDERKVVVAALIVSTQEGELEVKSGKASEDLAKYWSGTLSNWLRKDDRLNGGVKHEIKDPGSRAGAQDKALKNLKNLLIQVEANDDAEGAEQVKEAIEVRKSELQALKLKLTEIDVDMIPDNLKHLAS